MTQDQPTKPSRGILVFDSSDLHLLAAPILRIEKGSPLDSLPNETGTYLDVLSCLSQRGFKIIIPEMVGLEIARILRDNISIAHHGTKRNLAEPIKQFIATSKDSSGTIELAKADSKTSYGQLIEQLISEKKLGWNNLLGGKKKDAHASTMLGLYQRKNTRDILEKNDRRDFGEQHAIDVIMREVAEQSHSGHRVPIFFCNWDANANKILASKLAALPAGTASVHHLSANGLLLGLEKENIAGVSVLRQLGIPNSASDSWRCLVRSYVQAHKNPNFVPVSANDRVKDYSYTDNTEFPFRKALKGLAQEFIEERQERARHEVSTSSVSRAEQFRQKWGDRYKKNKAADQSGGVTP